MAKIGKSAVQSTLTYSLQLATSLALVIVVSRLLSPAEIGAYLIASAVMILILPLRDFQIQSYVIQRGRLDAQSLRPVASVAWLSAAASMMIIFGAAMVFSYAYSDTPIAACLLIMGVSLVIRPLALLPMSVLARDLRYGAIAGIQLAGAAAKVVVTLGLIAIGSGPEALAWGYVAELAAETLAVFAVSREVRLVRPSIAGVREVVQFAAPFSAANLVLTISLAAIPIIIGGFLGLAASAFFNRARTVSQFFRSSVEGAVHQIVLQRFAAIRDDISLLRSDYTRSIILLTAISWPSLVWLFLLAEPLTLLAFGQQWLESAVLMQGLAVAGILYSATAFSRQLHAAMDDTKALFMRDAWLQVPLLVAVVAAAQFSTVAVVFAVSVVSAVAFVVHILMLARKLETELSALATPLLASAFVAVVVGGATFASLAILGAGPTPLQKLIWSGSAAGGAWLLALFASRHPLLFEMLDFFRQLREPG